MIKDTGMLVFGNIRIEKIHINELAEAASLLADAFETNPAYALIFNHTGKVREGLSWLFRANLFLINRRQTVTAIVKENDSGKIIGTFSLIPPQGVKNSIFDYLHIGLFRFIRQFGFSTLQKMMGMDAFNKEALRKSMETEKYYYLSMVAVNEEYRGRGIGSFAIKHCLNGLAKTTKECRLVALTTQLPENVMLYSRMGFETIDEGYLDYKDEKYYNWNMKLRL